MKAVLLPELTCSFKFYIGSGIDLTGAPRQDIGAPVQKGGVTCTGLSDGEAAIRQKFSKFIV